MRQAPALTQCQRLCRRLEGAGDGFIVNSLSAWLCSAGGQSKVANGDALEMPELAVLEAC